MITNYLSRLTYRGTHRSFGNKLAHARLLVLLYSGVL